MLCWRAFTPKFGEIWCFGAAIGDGLEGDWMDFNELDSLIFQFKETTRLENLFKRDLSVGEFVYLEKKLLLFYHLFSENFLISLLNVKLKN